MRRGRGRLLSRPGHIAGKGQWVASQQLQENGTQMMLMSRIIADMTTTPRRLVHCPGISHCQRSYPRLSASSVSSAAYSYRVAATKRLEASSTLIEHAASMAGNRAAMIMSATLPQIGRKIRNSLTTSPGSGKSSPWN